MNNQQPNLILVMGGICSGKTEFRKNKYPAAHYTHIDAGEIFIGLSEGAFYGFPSHLEDRMNQIGLERLRASIAQDVVMELVGENFEAVKELLEWAKKIGYQTQVEFLECDIEDALQRNENRDENNISAYFCEPYHLDWFKRASMEYGRTLIGQSFVGLLATEILFKKPDLFDNYIIVSPSLWWDDERLLDEEPTASHSDKSIYIAGGKEGEVMERTARELYEKLKNNRPQNTAVFYEFMENRTHGDALHNAVYHAFEKIF